MRPDVKKAFKGNLGLSYVNYREDGNMTMEDPERSASKG
jgi:hypothetical protein